MAATPQRIGAGMLVAASVLLLMLLSWLFSDLLDQRQRPNRHLERGASGEVELLRNRHGHYLASGTINGQAVEFMLDTGATVVSVPAGVAKRLGLRPGAAQRVFTANGEVTVWRTELAQVGLGGITLRNVAAHINPGLGEGPALLGMSFLRHLELTQRGDTLTLRLPAPD